MMGDTGVWAAGIKHRCLPSPVSGNEAMFRSEKGQRQTDTRSILSPWLGLS